MREIIIPAAQGRAIKLQKNEIIKIITPEGGQAADFFCFNANNIKEWLSPPHTWVTTFHTKPRIGDTLLSRFRRPLMQITEDEANGIHDMLIAACDQFRYEFFGIKESHANCADNLRYSLQRIGYDVDITPQPVNFFTNTCVNPDGQLVATDNIVAAGSYVSLQAFTDVLCVVSSCPFDVNSQNWRINRDNRVTDLKVEIT